MTDEQLQRRLAGIRSLAVSLHGVGYCNANCPSPSEACWDIRFLLDHIDGLDMRIADLSARVVRLEKDNERLRERIEWRNQALKDAQQTKGELRSKIHDLKGSQCRKCECGATNYDGDTKCYQCGDAPLLSLAYAAKQLCEWTRHNQYPEKMTAEFMELTSLIDQLDTEVRRIFGKAEATLKKEGAK